MYRQRQRSSPGSQSPLKHLLWRLETEFENPPISGGWRGGPGQSRGGTARAHRPSESWRSEPRVWLSPAQLLPPQPPPPSGYLETSGPGANSCRGRGPGRPREAKVGAARGGGRRRRRALLLCVKGPLGSPQLAALGDRGHSLGWGKQMEFGKNDIRALDAAAAPPPPATHPVQPARKLSCPGLLGQTS